MLSSLQGGAEGDFHAVMVAGDPRGTPTDSPALRVDPNTTTSPFAGVGSLRISASSGTYICTGTPIDPYHVLTAGHCLDIDDNGVPDVDGVTFNLNYGGNLTSQIPAAAWETHPDFTGFSRPSVNDDLAVITLSEPLPAGVPIYSLATSNMVAGSTHLYMVGYGRSGDGVRGYSTDASFIVKRDGENIVDAFYTQDDSGRAAANEVFRFDFDGPKTNVMGGKTLGNDKETTLGGGDSGGPSFVLAGGTYYLAGVNTFTQGVKAPKFGSLGGGINVLPYTSWIEGVQAAGGSGGSSVTGGGGSALRESMLLRVMASGENPGLLTATDYLLGLPQERLPHDSGLNTSPQGEFGGALVNSPPLVSAAPTAFWESATQANSSWALGDKDDSLSADDSTRETEVWDLLAVDAIFESLAS